MSAKLLSLVATALLLTLTGCKKDGSAAAAAGSVPMEDFLSKVAPTACTTLVQCRNDKLKAAVGGMAMMIAAFGTMETPALASQMQAVSEGMKKDSRIFPNQKECETVGRVALQVLGLSPQALEGKEGKTFRYDQEKAAACLQALAAKFPPCDTEFKLTAEPKLSDLDAYGKEIGEPFAAQTKACEGVFTGITALGQACESDFECQGAAKCKGEATHRRCQAG